MFRKIALYTILTVVLLAALVVGVGYALPQNHVASVNAAVASPVDVVFAKLHDVSRYPEWRKDIARVEVLSTAPLKWREHASGGDVITYEVAENVAPQRLVTRIADPDLPFGGTWTYELRPSGGGTHVTITERGEVYNPVFRFMSRFVFSQTSTMEKVLNAL